MVNKTASKGDNNNYSDNSNGDQSVNNISDKLRRCEDILEAIDANSARIEFDMDGIIQTANKNFTDTVGYSLDEIVGKHHSIFAPPGLADSQEYKQFWNDLNRGQAKQGEFLRVGKDGNDIWLDARYSPINGADGKPAMVIKYATNITDKKASEEEGMRYKQMFDNLPINILLANTEGNIIDMNPASDKTLRSIQHLLPVAVDKIIGGSYDVFHKDPSHQRKLLADPRNLPHTTIIDVGEEKLDLLVSPLFDSNNNYTGPMVTWSVITEQIKAKERDQKVKRELDETILTLSTAFEALSGNSTALAANTSQIAGSSEDVQKYINSVGVAVEELVSSIGEISKNTDQAANMTKDSVSKIEGTQSIIQSLRDRSEEIASILKVVTEIANQTNLLALNATIEAARAGEAGKGFAVVANEVKELANRTAEATDDINKKIAAIQVESQSALDSISTASESVRSINEVAISIAGSVEEQTAVTSEIGKSMKSSTDKVEEMSDGVQRVGSLVEDNTGMTNDVEKVTIRLRALSSGEETVA